MFSLRILTRPSVLAPTLAATAAICGLVVWRIHASAPVSGEAPVIQLASESPATDISVRGAASDDPAPPAPATTALRLVRADTSGSATHQYAEDNWGYFPFAHDDRFPVVSPGGSIAVLFEDRQDFTDAPITTLVAWNKSGKRVASFAIGGANWSGDEKQVLASANKWLARTTWSSLGGEATAAWDEDNTVQTVTLAAGAPLVFDAATSTLHRAGRAVGASFGTPGWSESGSCGIVTGIQRAFGSPRLVVLVPTVNVNGDSCYGSPSADVAIAVALR